MQERQTVTNYELLQSLVQAIDGPVHYLEIGVQEGGSAEAVLQSEKVVFAALVDTWGPIYGGTNRGSCEHVVQRLGELAQKAIFISEDSRLAIPKLWHQFNLIFVDGDHSVEGCLADLENCLHLLSEDGYMAVDDIDHPQHTYLREVVAKFATEKGLFAQYLNCHCGVAVLTRFEP